MKKCPHCRGSGNLYYEPCSFCGGSGSSSKPMFGYPKDLPSVMKGLWKYQYAPREEALLSTVGKGSRAYKQYRSLRYAKRMKVIDAMHSKGLVI